MLFFFFFILFFFLAPAHSASVVDPGWLFLDSDLTSPTFSDPDPTQGHIHVSLEITYYSYICSDEIHLDPDSCHT